MATTIIPAEPELTLGTNRRTNLTQDEARQLTTCIQKTASRLWLLVTEAHDRKAHQALGYPTWDDYARAELKMSPSRTYQLLDTGHVMKALAQAGADLDDTPPPPARVVARVKDRLPEVQRVIRQAVRDGQEPVRVLRELAAQPQPREGVIVRGAVTPPLIGAPEPEAPQEAAGPELVVCPVCVGEGKVTVSLSRRAQSWLKRKPRKK